MTLLTLLLAFPDRDKKVVIKDEHGTPIANGTSWDFAIKRSASMKYEELHAREVDYFDFSDNTLYVYLE